MRAEHTLKLFHYIGLIQISGIQLKIIRFRTLHDEVVTLCCPRADEPWRRMFFKRNCLSVSTFCRSEVTLHRKCHILHPSSPLDASKARYINELLLTGLHAVKGYNGTIYRLYAKNIMCCGEWAVSKIIFRMQIELVVTFHGHKKKAKTTI